MNAAPRENGTDSKIAFRISLGLFAFSLVLPAVNLGPWLPGLNVFVLSFGGLVFSLHLGSPRHFAACLLGASANALMLFAYVRILMGRYSGAALASTTAMALMVLVLGPLNAMAAANAKGMVSFGYYFWVAAGFTLALSAWLRAWQMVKSGKQEGDMRTADRSRIILTVGTWLAILTILVCHELNTDHPWKSLWADQNAIRWMQAAKVIGMLAAANLGTILIWRKSHPVPAPTSS